MSKKKTAVRLVAFEAMKTNSGFLILEAARSYWNRRSFRSTISHPDRGFLSKFLVWSIRDWWRNW